MEEFKDIITGLEQRIHVYKSKLQELQKKREKIEDEIKTVKKYLELAETLYRVEVEKAKWVHPINQSTKSATESSDQSKEILLEKSKYVGLSVPQATFLLLKEAGKPLHAKEIYQKLLEGGVRIRGKTPITSVAISLARDKRFKKVAPNTFKLAEETGPEALNEKDPAVHKEGPERG
ncbi:MAG TPA: winged helix-turn-helix domain-containing protein [Candidatus Manganitrophaceae bacterium]|nr:winged helix-turn-helix domain-containing protein [Candidatus Manganitrophaceae bacterium]